jgi:hypothetical protein
MEYQAVISFIEKISCRCNEGLIIPEGSYVGNLSVEKEFTDPVILADIIRLSLMGNGEILIEVVAARHIIYPD